MNAERRYEPHTSKHKKPKGYGSICQDSVSSEHAQNLLDQAVPDPEGDGRCLYAVCGEAVFVARATRIEEGVWHGYPELGSRVPPTVLRAFAEAGAIDERTRRRLRRQKELPEACGCR